MIKLQGFGTPRRVWEWGSTKEVVGPYTSTGDIIDNHGHWYHDFDASIRWLHQRLHAYSACGRADITLPGKSCKISGDQKSATQCGSNAH